MQVLLANPRGFCAGVERALEIVERALERCCPPVYVRHELVHNKFVVQNLRTRGVVFVDDLTQIPEGSTVIFSAHGVSQAVQEEAAARQLQVLDATCPLVSKVHVEVARQAQVGREVVLIGHAGHPEVEGTTGRYNNSLGGGIYLLEKTADVAKLELKNPQELAFVTQTTLSMDDAQEIITALRERFPAVRGPKRDDICYATQNRQDAVRRLAKICEAILVVGSKSSSNSNRLRELAEKLGTPAYLIDSVQDIRTEWLEGVRTLGITAGASAPEILVTEVLEYLHTSGASYTEERPGQQENIVFPIPKILR